MKGSTKKKLNERFVWTFAIAVDVFMRNENSTKKEDCPSSKLECHKPQLESNSKHHLLCDLLFIIRYII